MVPLSVFLFEWAKSPSSVLYSESLPQGLTQSWLWSQESVIRGGSAFPLGQLERRYFSSAEFALFYCLSVVTNPVPLSCYRQLLGYFTNPLYSLHAFVGFELQTARLSPKVYGTTQ